MANQIGRLEVGVRLKVDDKEVQALRRSLQQTGDDGAKAIDKGLTNRLGQIGTNATRAGRQISFGLSLPMAAAGKAATDTYLRFDQSMTRIEALVGVNKRTVGEWGEQVKQIGSTYGQTADDTADALYFISSSGFEGAAATDLLTTSAKAAAVGLGTVQGVANTLSSAISAYGQTNLSSAKAADILTVAVREGKAEADQMGDALASVISPASTLGISFGELAGAMASMTLTGSSPDEVATQLGALMSTLTDMPPIAQRALKSYTGLEYGTLRMNLANRGLVPTLEEVFNAFKGNEAAMSEVFGNIRAWRGVMNMFGNNAKRTKDIIKETTEASGELSDAFGITAESASFKMQKAMADMNIAMTNIGAAVAPTVTSIVEGAAKIAGAFGSLPPIIKGPAVAMGLAAVAAGPLVYSFGALVQVGNGMSKVLKKVSPTFTNLTANVDANRAAFNANAEAGKGLAGRVGGVAGAATLAGAAIGATVAVYALWNARMEESSQMAATLGAAVRKGAGKGGIGAAEETIKRTNAAIADLQTDLQNLGNNPLQLAYAEDLKRGAAELYKEGQAVRQRITLANELAKATGNSADALYDWLDGEARAGRTYANLADGQAAYNKQLNEHAPAAHKVITDTQRVKDTFAGLIAEVKETSDTFFAVFDAQKKYADSRAAIVTAERGVVDAIKAHADAQKQVTAAARREEEAQRRAIDATDKLKRSRQALTDAQRELNDVLRGPSEDMRLDEESALIAVEEARRRLRDLGKAAPGERREPVDPLDRRRAQLDLRRAELDLQRVRTAQSDREAEARQRVADAEAQVADDIQSEVDARQAVVDARDAKTEATQRQADAFLKIREAQDLVAKAQLDAVPAAQDLTAKQELLASAFANGTFHGEAMRTYLTQMKDLYPELTTQLDFYIKKLDEMDVKFRGTPEARQAWYQENHPGLYGPPNPDEVDRYWRENPPIQDGSTLQDRRDYWYKAHPKTYNVPSIEEINDYWRKHHAPRRQFGGPVTAGKMYQVNEAQVPELFTAGNRQYLVPTINGRITPLASARNQTVASGGPVTIGDIYVSGPDPVATAVETRRKLRTKAFLAGA